MSEMNVRSDSVDVEQIMRQIRARIREKRGADYTEAEVQQLATVKLEKFLDPRGIRSDLVEQFRKRAIEPSPAPPTYDFEGGTVYDTHRGLLRSLRRILNPLLKLFFNPDKISTAFHVLHLQTAINRQSEDRLRRLEDHQRQREPLEYEVVHNLTLEVTRLGIEVHNLKMRVESLSSRLDFDERRGRALESVVQYKPAQGPRQSEGGGREGGNRRDNNRPSNQTPVQPAAPPAASAAPRSDAAPVSTAAAEPATAAPATPAAVAGTTTANGVSTGAPGERRRRRRRRRRRPGQTLADGQTAGTPRQGGDPDDTGNFADQDGADSEPGDDSDAGDEPNPSDPSTT